MLLALPLLHAILIPTVALSTLADLLAPSVAFAIAVARVGCFLLGVGFFLVWFGRRKAYKGQVFLLLVAIHECGKFLLEFLRAPVAVEPGRYLQPASLALSLLAAAILAATAIARWPSARRGTPEDPRRFRRVMMPDSVGPNQMH